MRVAFVISAIYLFPLAALAATRFTPPQVSPSEWPDTEASTNLVFDAGSAGENRWDMTFR